MKVVVRIRPQLLVCSIKADLLPTLVEDLPWGLGLANTLASYSTPTSLYHNCVLLQCFKN